MSRVEWSLLSGEDVEKVVAMLLCSEYPAAQRVRPGQGDGGIDVFVPGEWGLMRSRSVYQVKKFATNITSNQKRQIRRSLERVRNTSTREAWTIDDWHLVCPLVPTPANLVWFHELTKNVGFSCSWIDLDQLDLMAVRHQAVIDWYLHDGKERLSSAVEALASIIAGRENRRSGRSLTAPDIHTDLVAIHQAINEHDPHYRYGFEVSHLPPPTRTDEPGLIAVAARLIDSVWIVTKIYARCLASLEERPVPIQLRITVDHGSDLRHNLQRFIDYGAPVTIPAGTTSATIDLPGGLGGEITGGVTVLNPTSIDTPANGEAEDRNQILAALAPDGTVVAETLIERTDHTAGARGHRTVWRDPTNMINAEILADDATHRLDIHLKMRVQFVGQPPDTVADALKFCAMAHDPNRVALSPSFGPRQFVIGSSIGGDIDPELIAIARTAEALQTIQPHTTQRLLMPDGLTREQAQLLDRAAKLLSQQPISGTWTRMSITPTSTVTFDIGDIREFCSIEDLEIEINNRTILIGQTASFVLGHVTELTGTRITIEPAADNRCVQMLFRGQRGRAGHVMHRTPADDRQRAAPPSDSARSHE
ncbi:hypothetical protein [Nocardia nova]|uniref:hypothetical protein n=1 Tax=Nocardia nova TaxID=37330 RepID=UPI0033DD9D7B